MFLLCISSVQVGSFLCLALLELFALVDLVVGDQKMKALFLGDKGFVETLLTVPEYVTYTHSLSHTHIYV
jgi:hypothetical protein